MSNVPPNWPPGFRAAFFVGGAILQTGNTCAPVSGQSGANIPYPEDCASSVRCPGWIANPGRGFLCPRFWYSGARPTPVQAALPGNAAGVRLTPSKLRRYVKRASPNRTPWATLRTNEIATAPYVPLDKRTSAQYAAEKPKITQVDSRMLRVSPEYLDVRSVRGRQLDANVTRTSFKLTLRRCRYPERLSWSIAVRGDESCGDAT
jgi:hypothetical protein